MILLADPFGPIEDIMPLPHKSNAWDVSAKIWLLRQSLDESFPKVPFARSASVFKGVSKVCQRCVKGVSKVCQVGPLRSPKLVASLLRCRTFLELNILNIFTFHIAFTCVTVSA